MRNQKVLDLVYLAVFTSIMFVMAWVPFLGFIPIGVVSVTILHIPVLIALFLLGKRLGIYTGILFGALSCLIAIIKPTQLLDPYFANPLYSVVPRFLFILITAFIYEFLQKILKNKYAVMVVTSVIGTLIHSILVLGFLVVFAFPTITEQGTIGAAASVALSVLGTVSTLEALVAAIIAPAIALAVNTVKNNAFLHID